MRAVLVGGGHAHVHVLKLLGEQRPPGARLTLVARDVQTPYSGMIPGFVAGHYRFADCHIDLAKLCAARGIELIHGEAIGLDRVRRRVLLVDKQAVDYDLLSIDVGSAPNLDAIRGAAQWAIPVKPIAELGRRWLAFLDQARTRRGPLAIAVIGGGAGGVELALAIDHRLRSIAKDATLRIALIARDEILPGHAPAARRRLRAILKRRGIALHEHTTAIAIERDGVRLQDAASLEADAVFMVTQAAPAPWFAATGLPLDEQGFLAVEATLRSPGDPCIFAAGDCATVLDHRRPKAGVYAVRQGPPLAANLARALAGEAPLPFVPQRRHLAIIGTGDGRAVATRGWWAVEGRWVWRWKDHIDRRWMAQYR